MSSNKTPPSNDQQNEPSNSYLASVSFGCPFSYKLSADAIIGRVWGILPLRRVPLKEVQFIRLACRNEVSALFFILNWPQLLLTSQRSRCPVYILQTRKGKRIFLKLKGGAHFRLRQAIARHKLATRDHPNKRN